MLERALDLEGLVAHVGTTAGRPTLIHHFATWCDPCAEELPILAKVLRAHATSHRTIAISWDLFLTPVRPEQAIEACRSFLAEFGVTFEELVVYSGDPEALFASQSIASRTVPFTEVRDATGARVAEFAHPVFEPAEQQRLIAALKSSLRAENGREVRT